MKLDAKNAWATLREFTNNNLNSEFVNVITWWNDHDDGSRKWTTGSFQNGISGTPTNDSAASGRIGEYISAAASNVSFPATTVLGDLASISLTAGDWDVVGQVMFPGNVVTVTGDWQMGISQTSGNSSTGLVSGDNSLQSLMTSGSSSSLTIAGYRQSLSTTKTIYLKYVASYSLGTPKAYGRLSARRVR